jgi:Zn-dependent protease
VNAILSATLLLLINLGLLWLMMAAPVGRRTITVRRALKATPERIWDAISPKGGAANWHPSVLSSSIRADDPSRVDLSYSYPDRKGRPIRRTLEISRLSEDRLGHYAYETRVVEDSALDGEFWKNYREQRTVTAMAGGADLVVEQTDTYRGLAYLIFRYFSLRREMRAFEGFLATGKAKSGGWLFEHPLVQVMLGILSTLLLWSFFGFTGSGLLLSTLLTVVIVLHEFGHMAAYRAFGHQHVRMIFIPLLGGIAIGGRPYNSRFEMATCALMGPGMSAFLVPMVIAMHSAVSRAPHHQVFTGPVLLFLLILGSFNLLNLLPMYRFDGGQVLRQIFRGRNSLMAGSFAGTLVILGIGYRVGLSSTALVATLAVFTLMSLIGFGSIKPKEQLDEMSPGERLMTAFGLYSAMAIHGYAVIFACDRLFSIH